jgi:hypothetical protein
MIQQTMMAVAVFIGSIGIASISIVLMNRLHIPIVYRAISISCGTCLLGFSCIYGTIHVGIGWALRVGMPTGMATAALVQIVVIVYWLYALPLRKASELQSHEWPSLLDAVGWREFQKRHFRR